MSIDFSKPIAEHSDLYLLDKEINRGGWFQLLGGPAFPFPLKTRLPLSPPLITSELSFSSVEDKEGKHYGLSVWKFADRTLSVKIGDGSNFYCFEQGPQSFVTIQPLTDDEAQRVHIAAKAASVIKADMTHNISVDVWYV